MDWGFVPEITSICVLLAILVFHKKYSYKSNQRDKLFVRCIRASIIYSCIRTASGVSLVLPLRVPEALIYFLRDCSMLALMCLPLTLMEYALELVYEKNQKPYYKVGRVWAYLQVPLMALFLVLNRIRPILYYINDNEGVVFQSGAYIPALIVLCSMGIYLTAVLLEMRSLPTFIRNALLTAPLIALPFIIVQQFAPKVQLYGTAFMLNILVLYLTIHVNIKNYDKLTGCFTDKAFNIDLKRIYAKAQHSSFLIIELNNHALIRGEYGEQMALAIMRELALNLKQSFGQLNVYITSSNSFVCATLGQMHSWSIKEMHSKLNSELLVNGLLIKLECDMAFYETLDGRELGEELLNCLEFALKKAKTTNERFVPCDESVISEYALEKQLTKRLKEAIESDNYLLCFNPICKISGTSFEIIAADCCISFESSNGCVFSYEQIQPIAERNNLINPINELIFRRASAFAAKLKDMGYDDIKLFCAITHNQLRSKRISARLHKILKDEGAPNSTIVLELSGQAAPLDFSMNENIIALEKGGICTCLGDISRSCVGDALTAPFSFIKFNEAYLFKNGLNTRLNSFIKLMPAFFSRFGATVIAQNVVSAEHMRFLCERGIKYAQGSGVLKPLTEEELIAKLKPKQAAIELAEH